MKVYVCGESFFERVTLLDIVESLLKSESLYVKLCSELWEPRDVLLDLKKNPGPHIYLIDINIEMGIGGIQLAEVIKEKDPLGSIIFMNADMMSSRLALNSLIEPLWFFQKGEIKDQRAFRSQLLKLLTFSVEKTLAYTNLHPENDILELDEAGKKIRIHKSDIIYIEKNVRKKKTTIFTKNKIFVVNRHLKDLKLLLPDANFYKNFQSYVINLDQVELIDYTKGIIELFIDETIILSQSSLKRLKKDLKH